MWIALAVLAGTLNVPLDVADATGGAITLTTSSATVAPGAQVTLTAGMPVSASGTVLQEIVQTIDPTKVKLTGVDDITTGGIPVDPTGLVLVMLAIGIVVAASASRRRHLLG